MKEEKKENTCVAHTYTQLQRSLRTESQRDSIEISSSESQKCDGNGEEKKRNRTKAY